MANELISSYIDLAAIRKETDLFLEQISLLKKSKDELSKTKATLKIASNNKEIIDATNATVKAFNEANKAQDAFAQQSVNVTNAQKAAAKATKEATAETEKQVGAYDRLKKQFADADKEAKNLAAEFGVTSEQATKASASAAALKEQLAQINALSKTGGQPKIEVIPFSHNLNDDGTIKQPAIGNTTGTAVSDAEKMQVEGILTAKEYAAAQKGVSASFVETDANAKKYAATQKEIDLALAQDKLQAQKRTAELKNQVREETAVKGSIEQRRAALIRLNAVYDNLSPQERNSAAGQRLQKITKGVTDQLKELEAASGRAQRNVGNYPTNSFNGLKAQLKDVTEQYNSLSKAEQKTAQGKELKGKIDEISKSIKNFGDNSSVSFSKAYSGIRILANIIPGLGISGIFLLAGQAIASTVEWIKVAYGRVVDFAEKMKVLSEVNLKAIDGFAQQKSHIEGLTAVIRDGNISLNDKQRALNELIALDPKYLHGLSLANITTDEGKKILGDYIDLLRRKAELEAAGAVQGDASKEVYKLEVIKDLLRKRLVATKTNYDDLTEEELKYLDKVKTSTGRINFTASLLNLEVPKSDIQEMLVGVDKELTKAGKKVTASLDVFKDKFKAVGGEEVKLGIVEELKKQISDLDKAIDTETVTSKISGLVSSRKKLQDQLDALLGKEKGGKARDLKTISDAVSELRRELSKIQGNIDIGQITIKEADVDRVKAYQKAFDQIFERGGKPSNPVVQQLTLEVSPISKRVLEAQIHDIVSKAKTAPINIEPPKENKVLEYVRASHETEIAFTEEMLQRELTLQQTASLNEQAVLQEKYNAGRISKEEYERSLLEIQDRYSKEAVASQIKAVQAEIDLMDVGTTERENAEKRLAELILKYNGIISDDRKKKNAELISDIQKIQEVFNQLTALGSSVVNLSITKQKNDLQDLEDTRQKNYDQELDRINNSALSEADRADKVKLLEAKRQAQKDEYDRKNRDIQQKQAKYEKDVAIMNIILNTAASIAKVLYDPFQVAFAAVFGAAQLAIAVATPIPRYQHGTKSHPGGEFLWGEAGTELAIEPSGKMYLSPDKPTLGTAPVGTKIIPNYELHKYNTSSITTRNTDRIISNSSYGQTELAVLFKENTSELKNVHRAIRSIPQTKISIHAKHDPNFQIWVNKNVKGR